MKKYLLLIFTVFTITSNAYAELSDIVIIEKSIEERVTRILHKMDSDSQVNVKLKLRELSLELPGTSFDYFGNVGIKTIESSDVESIEVHIISKLVPFPKWVEESVRTAVGFSGVKTNLVIKSFDDEMISQMYAHQPLQRFYNHIEKNYDSFKKYGVITVGIVTSVLITLLVWLLFWTPYFLKQQIRKVVVALESFGVTSPGFLTERPVKDSFVDPKSKSSAQLLDEEIDLPDLGLIELLADCYWVESDGYARWIWDALNSKQKQNLLNLWKPLRDYAVYIQEAEPQVLNFHKHPYYLSPLEIKNVNQKALIDATRNEPQIWKVLSPMRQLNLSIPLKIKIKMLNEKTEVLNTNIIKNISSELRPLSSNLNFGDISIEDEISIWENEEFVSKELRPKISSLVWVAKLQESIRVELLSKYSAVELASCWVGPKEVLDILQSSVPEKKWKLVEGYLRKNSPSRNTSIMKHLSNAAVRALPESEGSENEISKAS